MNEVPPSADDSVDIDEQYRHAAAVDASRPNDAIRRSVLEHATKMAAQRAAVNASAPIDFKRPAANQSRWRPAIVGTLAAAGLAGLLITPRFFSPPAPSSAAISNEIPVAAVPPAMKSSVANESTVSQPARESTSRLAASDQTQRRRQDSAAVTQASGAAPALATAQSRSEPAMAPTASGTVDGSVGSPLMSAIQRGQLQTVKELLASGADPNAANATGLTPLQAALAAHQTEIVDVLRRAGAR